MPLKAIHRRWWDLHCDNGHWRSRLSTRMMFKNLILRIDCVCGHNNSDTGRLMWGSAGIFTLPWNLINNRIDWAKEFQHNFYYIILLAEVSRLRPRLIEQSSTHTLLAKTSHSNIRSFGEYIMRRNYLPEIYSILEVPYKHSQVWLDYFRHFLFLSLIPLLDIEMIPNPVKLNILWKCHANRPFPSYRRTHR